MSFTQIISIHPDNPKYGVTTIANDPDLSITRMLLEMALARHYEHHRNEDIRQVRWRVRTLNVV